MYLVSFSVSQSVRLSIRRYINLVTLLYFAVAIVTSTEQFCSLYLLMFDVVWDAVAGAAVELGVFSAVGN